jgi:hypothetical protein
MIRRREHSSRARRRVNWRAGLPIRPGNQVVPERTRMGQASVGEEGIAYQALDNGFLSCAEPKKLQEICDSLRSRCRRWPPLEKVSVSSSWPTRLEMRIVRRASRSPESPGAPRLHFPAAKPLLRGPATRRGWMYNQGRPREIAGSEGRWTLQLQMGRLFLEAWMTAHTELCEFWNSRIAFQGSKIRKPKESC